MSSSNNGTKSSKGKKSTPKNSLTHLREVARKFVKETFPESKNGFEAFLKIRETTTKLLTEHSEEELLAVFFGLTASSPAISHFISEYDKESK